MGSFFVRLFLFLFRFACFFKDSVFLCRAGFLETHYASQASLEITVLLPHLRAMGEIGTCHHVSHKQGLKYCF